MVTQSLNAFGYEGYRRALSRAGSALSGARKEEMRSSGLPPTAGTGGGRQEMAGQKAPRNFYSEGHPDGTFEDALPEGPS